MREGDDSDPAHEFDDVPATTIDMPPLADDSAIPTIEIEPDTAPHDVTLLPGYEPGYATGRTIGWHDGFIGGREETLEILRSAFLSFGQADDTAKHVEAWIRARFPPI